MLGVRKTGVSRSERGTEKGMLYNSHSHSDSKEKDSHFSFTPKEKKPITNEYRKKKMEEREERKKYEEFKKKHEIENIKNCNLESLKRRDDQNRRKEKGGTYADRYNDVSMRTPMNVNKKRTTVTYTRNARRKKGVWSKISFPDFCTIF